MSMASSRTDDLDRVRRALDVASAALTGLVGPSLRVDRKAGGDPVTEADHAINTALRASLPHAGEGWLSEESADDRARLRAARVWIVDPLDGTREFVSGLPEWCISIALVEDGEPMVGGICNPATGETIVGGVGLGVTLNGRAVQARDTRDLAGADVLASRSEVARGEWAGFSPSAFTMRPLGSVAYKMALVAAGLADATWTLVPKHEWDVAAGVALVRASGGAVWIPSGETLTFNSPHVLLPGLVATAPGIAAQVRALLSAVAAPVSGASPSRGES